MTDETEVWCNCECHRGSPIIHFVACCSNADMPMVGEYFADYSPLTPEEIAAPVPELDELYQNSRPAERANTTVKAGDARDD